MESQYPSLSELPNGSYTGLWYAHCFELPDGRIFHTDIGVKHLRCAAKLECYRVVDGHLKPL